VTRYRALAFCKPLALGRLLGEHRSGIRLEVVVDRLGELDREALDRRDRARNAAGGDELLDERRDGGNDVGELDRRRAAQDGRRVRGAAREDRRGRLEKVTSPALGLGGALRSKLPQGCFQALLA